MTRDKLNATGPMQEGGLAGHPKVFIVLELAWFMTRRCPIAVKSYIGWSYLGFAFADEAAAVAHQQWAAQAGRMSIYMWI